MKVLTARLDLTRNKEVQVDWVEKASCFQFKDICSILQWTSKKTSDQKKRLHSYPLGQIL